LGLLVGFFVAATFVTLLQYLRMKEKRLLPLLAFFALLAMAHAFPGPASAWLHAAAGAAGLTLLVVLSPRHPKHR